MSRTLVLIHTIPLLVAAFDDWCREMLPGTRVLNILDEPLLARVRERGIRAPEDDERLAEHVAGAAAIGADAVLVTCSTVSQSVAAIRPRFRVAIYAIDEPMVRAAVDVGDRIAVVATSATTLEPSRTMLEREAARRGRSLEISLRLVDGALSALLTGDPQAHDRLVMAAVAEEAHDVDVVVLAQATMARALDAAGARQVGVPVLASPRLALAQVRRELDAIGPSAAAPPHPEVRQ